MALGIYTTPEQYRKYQKKIGAIMAKRSSRTGTTGRIDADEGMLTQFDPTETNEHILRQVEDNVKKLSSALGDGSSTTLYKLADWRKYLSEAKQANSSAAALRNFYATQNDRDTLAYLDELQSKLKSAEQTLTQRSKFETKEEYDAARGALAYPNAERARAAYTARKNAELGKDLLEEGGGSAGTLHTMANGRSYVTGRTPVGSKNGQLPGLQQVEDYLAGQAGEAGAAARNYESAGTQQEKDRALALYNAAMDRYQRAKTPYGTLRSLAGADNLVTPQTAQLYGEAARRIKAGTTGKGKLPEWEFSSDRNLVRKYGNYTNYLYGKIVGEVSAEDLKTGTPGDSYNYFSGLAAKKSLTGQEKENYKAYRGTLVQQMTEERDPEKKREYLYLTQLLDQKTAGKAQAAAAGFLESASFGLAGQLAKQQGKREAGQVADPVLSGALKDQNGVGNYQKNAPGAYRAGSVAGSVGSLMGLGSLEGAALGGIKGFVRMGSLAKSVVSSAALFGSDAMLRSAASQNWDESVS